MNLSTYVQDDSHISSNENGIMKGLTPNTKKLKMIRELHKMVQIEIH